MSDYLILTRLGLSKTAASCYESLFNDGIASVPQLSARLALPRTGLYRLLRQLETTGYVAGLKTASQPYYYRAKPLDEALRAYAAYQRRLVNHLINEQEDILVKRSGG